MDMELFKDLTFYSRNHYENALNIGWVAPEEPLANAEPDHALLQKLIPYLAYPFNTTRESGCLKVEYQQKQYTLGYSEIRVISASGQVYAAPDMIVSHILNCEYTPPAEFRDAVLYGLDPNSDEYQNYYNSYSFENFWGAQADYIQRVQHLLAMVDRKDVDGILSLSSEERFVITERGSLLNAAIENRDEDFTLSLLNSGISIDSCNGIELVNAVRYHQNRVALRLLTDGIPMFYHTPNVNPLFIAIAVKNNEIAKALMLHNKKLVQIYSNAFLRDCNILQWAMRYKNLDFVMYLQNYSQVIRGDVSHDY